LKTELPRIVHIIQFFSADKAEVADEVNDSISIQVDTPLDNQVNFGEVNMLNNQPTILLQG
jgi:hypothetical protein